MKIGILDILTLVFIALKVSNNINWDWVWVLSPFWITSLIGIGILIERYTNPTNEEDSTNNEKKDIKND